MISAVFQLQVRQVFAGQRKWLLLVGMAIPLLVLAMLRFELGLERFNEDMVRAIATIALYLAFGLGVTTLAALLYGTAVINAEVHHATLTYLFTRNISRGRVVLGKYLANVVILTVCTGASVVVGWLVFGQLDVRLLAGILSAVVLSTVAYNAVFTLIGTLFPNKTLVSGVVYLGALELAPSFVPAVVREFTIGYHTRSVAIEVVGLPAVASELDEEIIDLFGLAGLNPLGSLITICGITAGALFLSCWIATRREFSLADQP